MEDPDTILKPKFFVLTNYKCLLLSENDKEDMNNIYEHMVNLIKEIIKNESVASMETFEDLSLISKRFKLRLESFLLPDVTVITPAAKLARVREPCFKIKRKQNETGIFPDLQRVFHVFEQAGVGLTKDEVIMLSLSVRKFGLSRKYRGLRFWGKMFGTKSNYYVLESDSDEVVQEENIGLKFRQNNATEKVTRQEEVPNVLDLDSLIIPDWKPPPDIPPEDPGKGLNRKMYHVCNTLGEPWIRLPDVSPNQVFVSRTIQHICTGDLEAELQTYPSFPGVEKNYLRAQIARITANTAISPINFYQFDEEEEEGAMEEDSLRESFVENPEYEPMSIFELSDPSLANWVHHSPYILPQGRTVWWNPSQKSERSEDGGKTEDEDEELLEVDEPEPETGPPLLTPLSEDAEVNGLSPWSTRITSRLIPHYAYAVLSSNVWPGAHAIASGRSGCSTK